MLIWRKVLIVSAIVVLGVFASASLACVDWELGAPQTHGKAIYIDTVWGYDSVYPDAHSSADGKYLIAGPSGNHSFLVALDSFSDWDDEPTVLGYLYFGAFWPAFEKMCTYGDYAYLSTSDSELLVIDTADPQLMSIEATITQADICRDLLVDEDRALLIAAEWLEVRIYDISQPENPSLIGSIPAQYARAMALQGDILYVASSNFGLRVLDISNPGSPVQLAHLFNVGHVRDVALWGDHLLMVGPTIDLNYLDISTPGNPINGGTVACDGDPTEIISKDGYAYIIAEDAWGSHNDQLQVYRLFNPLPPVLLGYYNGYELSNLYQDHEIMFFNDDTWGAEPLVATQFQCAPTSDVVVPLSAFPTLFNSWPNPFNPQTTIAFDMPSQAAVRLSVYDVSGRLVNVLIGNQVAAQGRNEAVWRGCDMAGRVVSAGVYFYRLEVGSFSETKRMMLVK